MRMNSLIDVLINDEESIELMVFAAQDALESDRHLESVGIGREEKVRINAVAMSIGQIGENCSRSKLSEETCQYYDHIDWKRINAFRNIVYHKYEDLDEEKMFEIVDNLLEDLIEDLTEVRIDLQRRIDALSDLS